ncbi:unnamed protein product [Trichobilharzia szidati]|nr:unnamed protein product [Trichobilharzia szidati]
MNTPSTQNNADDHHHHTSSVHESTAIGENCPSCRVVSSVIPITLSAYIMYVCKDQIFKYAGAQKVSYLTICTGMSVGLLYLGVRQLFRH